MPATSDNHNLLDDRAMGWRQILAIAVTVMLNALDGFDVLSISFAAPGIVADWGISQSAVGIVLSVELVGMVIGSLTLGRLGDRIGRKPTALACLALMATGMLMVPFATGITSLCGWRILTGTGIGGMLAVTNAMASELSNRKHRSLSISIMVIGYPLGAVLGGMLVAQLLKTNSWQIIFDVGGIATLAMIPLVIWLIPETPGYLVTQDRPGALARLNASLRRLGHDPVDAMPPALDGSERATVAGLFRGDVGRTTRLLTLAYFCQIASFYFIVKWVPKIVTDFGFDQSQAATVLVWANVGGIAGCILWGLTAVRIGVARMAMVIFAASAAGIAAFGVFGNGLQGFIVLAMVGGCFANGAMAALYNLAALGFPNQYRSTGTGFVIGVGRIGGICGPVAAGWLFQGGAGLPLVAIIMATGSIGAMLSIAWLLLKGPLGRLSVRPT